MGSKYSHDTVTRQPKNPARAILVYGQPKVGKTTLVADAPGIIFLPVEAGLDEFDVPRLPRPETFDEVIEALDFIARDPSHYKYLGIDTLDALEVLIHRAMCGTKFKSVEDWGGGYNKWRQGALAWWTQFLAAVDRVRAAGVHVVMIGHSVVKGFKDPESDGWDKYQLRIEAQPAGLLTGYADAILFARHEDLRAPTDEKKGRGVGTGKRFVQCQHSASAEAGNRLGLPPRVDMLEMNPWAPIHQAIVGGSADDLRAQIAAEAKGLAMETAIVAHAAKLNDRAKLRAVLDKVKKEKEAA